MFKKKWPWMIAFLVIAVFTVWAVISQSHSFSFSELKEEMARMDPGWLFAAILSMVANIVLEGLALSILIRGLTGLVRWKEGIVYGAADIYFAAITPSSSGGQPAIAAFMTWDGVPIAKSTVVILVNQVLYTGMLFLIGVFVFPFQLDFFFALPVLAQVLIVGGALTVLLLTGATALLLFWDRLVRGFLTGLIRFGSKIRLVKNPEKRLAQVDGLMVQYRECRSMLRGKGRMVLVVLAVSFCQRLVQNLVTPFCYLAMGGKVSNFFPVFALQLNTSLAGHIVPIPGGMGAADYILVNGLALFEDVENAANLELICRGLSFYISVLLCLAIVVVASIRRNVRKKNKE